MATMEDYELREARMRMLGSKPVLTANEASEYTGIGIARMKAMMRKPDCPFVLMVGQNRKVLREQLLEYLVSKKKF